MSDIPKKCRNGCDYFGSVDTQGLCSVCFKRFKKQMDESKMLSLICGKFLAGEIAEVDPQFDRNVDLLVKEIVTVDPQIDRDADPIVEESVAVDPQIDRGADLIVEEIVAVNPQIDREADVTVEEIVAVPKDFEADN